MAESNTYFIYARKSTDVEDKQIRSIESQLIELREFAAREKLEVVAEFVEKKSARAPGRTGFDAMLTRIELGEASGILAWHPDRLARNSIDGGRIIYLLDTHVLKTLKFPTTWFENTPQGKFTLQMAFVQSKYYVDSLSENTKRGLRDKVRRGEFPSMAPIGYLNDYRIKRIIPDHERGPIVREMFERYAAGAETFDTLRQFLADRGVKSKKSDKLLSRASVATILRNPIYYGNFKWGGQVHEGTHEPLVTKRLFDEAQSVMRRRFRWTPETTRNVPKPFVRLLRCGECGGAITAEVQKGHTYYRCTKKGVRRNCTQPYVREEVLDFEITRLLVPLAISDSIASELLTLLEADRTQTAQANAVVISEIKTEVERTTARLNRLQDALIDGLFGHEKFRAENSKLMSRKKTLEEQCAALTSSGNMWLEPCRNWILEAQTLAKVANQGSRLEKRGFAEKAFGSNLFLARKKAHGKAVEPWSLLGEKRQGETLVSLYYRARNYFQKSAGVCSHEDYPSSWNRTGRHQGQRSSKRSPPPGQVRFEPRPSSRL